ncbi:MAG: hypothetical protein RIC35_18965 [Marinoscillum sp.]
MNELDELKEIWQSELPKPMKSLASNQSGLVKEINDLQKKILRSNIVATICMSSVVVFLTSLIFIYPEEKPLFYIALISVDIISIAVVFLLWSRRIKSGHDLSLNSNDYACHQLKKLNRTRLIIEFSPLYGLLLGILVSLYSYSLISEASGEFVFWMTNINWIYIMLISFISYRIKIKRFHKKAGPIINQLNQYLEA